MILDEKISGKERIKFVHLRLGSRENQVGRCVGYACTQPGLDSVDSTVAAS